MLVLLCHRKKIGGNMKMRRKRKNFLTLLEVMIVVVLIGLIGSVIGYNMKGGLDKGKVFKTEQAMAKVRDILLMMVSEGSPIQEVASHPEEYLMASGLCKKPDDLMKDGWGHRFTVVVSPDNEDIQITSAALTSYQEKERQKKEALQTGIKNAAKNP
jgi:type II secretory pathway pseudopilin PulG